MRGHIRIAAVAALLLVGGYATADRLELIAHVNLWDGSPVRSSDTAGLMYHPASGHLIIVDSEISEYGESTDANGELVFAGHNVFEASLDLKTRYAAYFAPPDSGTRTEPVGIAYNPLDDHLYVTDDDRKRILRFRFDEDGKFGPPIAATPTTLDGRYTDPEGIACDQTTGVLYVASGTQQERVLKYRFDVETGQFVFLGEFSVEAHISDPEGIGVDPVTGNVFLVSRGGIAEFTTDGAFVQLFDFAFLGRPDVAATLPGGLTFAPSSDPNDHPDIHSIYVSHRGIDNGKFPKQNTLDGAISEIRLVREPVVANPVRVPADHPTIQAAIGAATDGDTIVVSPGVYAESLVLADKALTLVSMHFLTSGPEMIDETVIDGGGGDYAVRVSAAGSGTTISGFTIRNADDGITADVPFTLTHCHVTETSDGIDYEGGGGLVKYCRFTGNRDDGIDLDGPTAATIEHCVISDNGDDGVEIRLHPYTGGVLPIHIRNNRIERNGEDGIQLIDYDTVSDRTFLFEGNVIAENAMAGIGCMASANTREDYSGAPIPEPIHVFGNTFAGNSQHLTGGGNLLAANNIFAGARVLAVSNAVGNSQVLRNLFWSNGADHQDSNIDVATTLHADPLLDAEMRFEEGSPAIDAGVTHVAWRDSTVRVVAPAEYRGSAPDLGAWESE